MILNSIYKYQAHTFYLISPSPWPLYISIILLGLALGAALTFHNSTGALNILSRYGSVIYLNTNFLNKTYIYIYDELKNNFTKLILLQLKKIFFSKVKNLLISKIPVSKLIFCNPKIFFSIIETAKFLYKKKTFFIFYLHKLEKKIQSFTFYQVCTYLICGYLLAMGLLIIYDQLFDYYVSFSKLTEVYVETLMGPILKMFGFPSNNQGGNGYRGNNMGYPGGGGGKNNQFYESFFASKYAKNYTPENKDDYREWFIKGEATEEFKDILDKARDIRNANSERLSSDSLSEQNAFSDVVKELEKIPGYAKQDYTSMAVDLYMTSPFINHTPELANAYKIWKEKRTSLNLDQDIANRATNLITKMINNRLR